MVQIKVTMGKQPIFRQQRTPQSKINIYGGGFTGVCYFVQAESQSEILLSSALYEMSCVRTASGICLCKNNVF